MKNDKEYNNKSKVPTIKLGLLLAIAAILYFIKSQGKEISALNGCELKGQMLSSVNSQDEKKTSILNESDLEVQMSYPVNSQDEKKTSTFGEYELKAGYIYNFVKFVEWSSGPQSDQNKSIVISIIGYDPFGDKFDDIKNKIINNRSIIIRRFPSISKLREKNQAEYETIIDVLNK